MNSQNKMIFIETIKTALTKDILIRSTKVALVVGTILGLINHGDAMVAGNLTIESTIKIAVSYCVPFSVSTWSAVQTVKSSNTAIAK